MKDSTIYKTPQGISYKIVNGEKWCIHKDTEQPVMLLKEYIEKKLVWMNEIENKFKRKIPNQVIDEVLNEE